MQFIQPILLISITFLFAQYEPDFGPETVLRYTDGAAYQPAGIKIGSSPCLYDWDGDGKRDLLIGEFEQGRISFLKNVNTDDDPQFNKRDYYLEDENGTTISTASG